MPKIKGLEIELLVICDYAASTSDNKLTIAGIFDEVYVDKLPAQHPKLFVVGIVRGEADSEHKLAVSVKDPGGKDVFPSQQLTIKLGRNGKTNLIANVASMVFMSSGTYIFEISTNGRVFGKKELDVVEVEPKNNTSSRKLKYTN